MVSVNEEEFILGALKEGRRLDCRSTHEYRNITITPNIDYGNVKCTLGNTIVSAKVSCEPKVPLPERPTEGFLRISCELNITGRDYDKVAEEQVLLNRTLEKAIKGSRAIEMEGLCIVAGKMVWDIRIDIHVLNNDGNLVGCASIAAIAAILHFRRPDVTVIGEDVTFHSIKQKNPVPLSIHHLPITITFCFYDNGQNMVLDPTLIEEQLKEGDMLITMNSYKEICSITKTGGVALDLTEISKCCDLAFVRASEIIELIQESIKKDLLKRDHKDGSLMSRGPKASNKEIK